MQTIQRLKEKLSELTHLKSTLAVLSWDQEVNMPSNGSRQRGETMAYLAGLLHDRTLELDKNSCITELKALADAGKLSSDELIIVNETWREYEREKKLPKEFVEEYTRATTEATDVWVKARKANDFALFTPQLAKIVGLSRKYADYLGYKDSPYDALLDIYEPGATTAEVAVTLNDLKEFLVPFIQQIQDSSVKPDTSILKGNFPLDKQRAFNKLIAETIGFDFASGRTDVSAHPFCTSFHPQDVRFTTRYDERDVWYSIGSTIHEVGHGLYEQGLNHKEWGTPLAEYISLGIHESQSRVWENQVGKGIAFWHYFYPLLQKEFPKPFAKISFDDFYRAINVVTPSLIRTESDEVTYNLHIIIRFEIEKALIEGTIEVAQLPEIWNQKYTEYLGVYVPDFAHGVLQDVHWAHGSFGYFPTYSLGNLYAAQLYSKAKHEILNLEEEFANGSFTHFLYWLRQKIHIHGKRFTAGELIQEITGNPLSSSYFINYLKEKYTAIYKLEGGLHD